MVMLPDDSEQLLNAGPRRTSCSIEKHTQMPEDPRIAQTTAPDDHAIEEPPMDGPEIKFRFGRYIEKAYGARVFTGQF